MPKLLLCFILTICCDIANAQGFYTLQMCRTAYHLRMYETIMPSLLHIKSEAENANEFDANKYLGAVELLCAIYTNYQKDTENSAKTMEEALKTLNLKIFFISFCCNQTTATRHWKRRRTKSKNNIPIRIIGRRGWCWISEKFCNYQKTPYLCLWTEKKKLCLQNTA